MRIKIVEDYPRGYEDARLSCGGYDEKRTISATKEEIKAYDCGRDWTCCSALFKFLICDKEFIATFESPDME